MVSRAKSEWIHGSFLVKDGLKTQGGTQMTREGWHPGTFCWHQIVINSVSQC